MQGGRHAHHNLKNCKSIDYKLIKGPNDINRNEPNTLVLEKKTLNKSKNKESNVERKDREGERDGRNGLIIH